MWKMLVSGWARVRGREQPAPKDPVSRLREEPRRQALEEARWLLSQGVWVRPLHPGENPDGEPEVAAHPCREERGRLLEEVMD